MLKQINGAKWWKFDFHNHSPKSFDYGHGDENERSISAKDWLQLYMSKEIDCIAITDHNTGAFVDDVKRAYIELKTEKPDWFRELFIFPGVELTVNGGIHLIAIFDPSKTGQDIAQIIGECKYKGTTGDSDGVTTESLESVISIINDKEGIAIPAHVDKNAGLFKQQNGITLNQTIRNNRDNLLAIEVIDSKFELPEVYTQNKLDLAKIVGSDSHKPDEIGRSFTWIKMGNPSIEALKLALHDGEDGVQRYDEIDNNPNNISQRYFIKSLSISQGYKAGNSTPLISSFSPWLTSIIGGRGSGKSSIINYLRILFDRTCDMPEEVQNDFDKFNKIGQKNDTGMLRDNTCIEGEIIKDNKLYKIKWFNGQRSIQTWISETESWSDPKFVTNIKELFPIQVFNQKELYALTNSPSKLIDLIDSQFDKKTWIDEKKKFESDWLSKRMKKRQLEEIILDEENLQASLNSVINQIELLESSKFKETLSKFNKYSKVSTNFEILATNIENFINELAETKNSIPEVLQSQEINSSIDETTLDYINSLNENLDEVKKKLDDSLNILGTLRGKTLINLNSLPWHAHFIKSKEEYDSINDQVEKLGIDSYSDLIKRRDTLIDNLNKIKGYKDEMKKIDDDLASLYACIIEKEKELRTKRNEVIDRWKSEDNNGTPILTIELDPMADLDNANSTFRKLLRKESNEYSQYILLFNDGINTPEKGLIANIVNEPIATRWSKREAEINAFISCTASSPNSIDTRLARHLDTLKSTTPEDIDRLLIWVPEDKLNLKFKKQGCFVNIDTGSAGEKTAGMLGLLLILNKSPLIIDQPEDDLDTSLISNFVVSGFKNLKRDRQLIIVTHNPNIAVNANSDNIIFMNFVAGQISVSDNDALQNAKIRNAVCDIMEGGKLALDKRYYRISKALK